MKLKERIKTYKFWVALSAALIIFANAMGKAFNFEISSEIIDGIVMGFCGILVVCGFVEKPKEQEKNTEDETKE